jgi:hypothetical protein
MARVFRDDEQNRSSLALNEAVIMDDRTASRKARAWMPVLDYMSPAGVARVFLNEAAIRDDRNKM